MRVLIIDDSLLFRKILAQAVGQIKELELVGEAPSGTDAIAMTRSLKPDLLTLDLEMPGLSGYETLIQIKKEFPKMPVIMVSAHTKRGATETISCLEAGAFAFITKPDGQNPQDNLQYIVTQLRLLSSSLRLSVQNSPKSEVVKFAHSQSVETKSNSEAPYSGAKIVAIGSSTGGPKALTDILPHIPANFPIPILICQHMPPLFTASLAQSLDKKCPLHVVEASHKEIITSGNIYIAPGGKQMGIQRGLTAGQIEIILTDDPPENNCRPSVDYMFRSIASIYQGSTLAMILTGMGNDGTMGLRRLKRVGARVIAQDEASCVVFGMPKEAINAGVVDKIVPITSMCDEMLKNIQP